MTRTSDHGANSGITAYTGRFNARGEHRDGKIHRALHGFELRDKADNVAVTVCGRIIHPATVYSPGAWGKLQDRCARCVAVPVTDD